MTTLKPMSPRQNSIAALCHAGKAPRALSGISPKPQDRE
jgi:hypothetical protein